MKFQKSGVKEICKVIENKNRSWKVLLPYSKSDTGV